MRALRGQCSDADTDAALKLLGAGVLVMKTGRHRRPFYDVLCTACHDKADHSSAEDRCCGDAAYEDACAQACGV